LPDNHFGNGGGPATNVSRANEKAAEKTRRVAFWGNSVAPGVAISPPPAIAPRKVISSGPVRLALPLRLGW